MKFILFNNNESPKSPYEKFLGTYFNALFLNIIIIGNYICAI